MNFESGIYSIISVIGRGDVIVHKRYMLKTDTVGLVFHKQPKFESFFRISDETLSEMISKLYDELHNSNIVMIDTNRLYGTTFLTRFVLYVIIVSCRKSHQTDSDWCILAPEDFEFEFKELEDFIPVWNVSNEVLKTQADKCINRSIFD